MNAALAIEGELTIHGPSETGVRITAQGQRIVVALDGLRQALELRRSLGSALPSEAGAGLTRGLRIAGLALEFRIRGRSVATLGATRGSWLAARMGFPGLRLHWPGLARTLLLPGRAGPGARSGQARD